MTTYNDRVGKKGGGGASCGKCLLNREKMGRRKRGKKQRDKNSPNGAQGSFGGGESRKKEIKGGGGDIEKKMVRLS